MDEALYRAIKAQTIAYYEANASAYADRVAGATLTNLYQRFLPLVPRGGRILDVGCGSGRDLKVFSEMGFEALGVDPSPTMVTIAAQTSGCPTVAVAAEDMDYHGEFDAAWACASLLHLPRTGLSEALYRIRCALVANGVIFVSMLPGDSEGPNSDGRYFTKYDPEEFRGYLSSSGFLVLDTWFTEDSLTKRRPVGWVNFLARKK